MPENSGRVDIQSWNAPRMPRKSGAPHRHPDRVRSFTIGRSHRPEGPACHNVIDMVQLSHLALAWASDPSRPDWPNATILVDGVDPFAGRMAGFDPGDIFGDDRPLLPDRVGRRVAVVRCTCGEAGCGVAAPEIRMSSEGVVSWTDFRTYTGVFIGPTTEYELGGGRSLEYPNMYFDAGAYAAEGSARHGIGHGRRRAASPPDSSTRLCRASFRSVGSSAGSPPPGSRRVSRSASRIGSREGGRCSCTSARRSRS